MNQFMIIRFRSLVLLTIAAWWMMSCQDPITLGNDLLDEDQAMVGFTDTLSVVATSIESDSVRVYSNNPANQLRSYLFGNFEDPLFGQARSGIYAQVRLESIKPNFEDATLDSVVLVLPYDTNGIYGSLDATFGMEVYRMIENIDRSATYFSDVTFATDPTPIGSSSFRPSLDSIEVVEFVTGTLRDTIAFPHLRIPLDASLGNELLQLDTFQTDSDTSFLKILNGIYLLPDRPTPGLLSFALNRSPYTGGIYLYYTQQDTLKRQYQFAINQLSARIVSFQHEYSGAPVEAFIDNPETGDSLLFIQGMNGLNTELEIQDLESLEGVIINKAELVVTRREIEGDTLDPARQILISYYNDEGDLVLINDAILGLNLNDLDGIFGGMLDEENGTYTMNITSHLQRVLNGEVDNKLVLTILGKAENADRSVLYGTGHPEFGVKIRLAFTEL